MRICVLQSSYDGVDHPLKDIDTMPADPSPFTDQHTVEHRWIVKAKAREQIDAIATENFDFHINFMWGLYEDDMAGVEASQYFESLDLPSAGIRSWFLTDSKLDFYRHARKAGSPRIPGTTKFPLFVKPAFGYASLHIQDDSICMDQAEVNATVARIKKDLAIGRPRKKEAGYESFDSEDIVIQEYIDGPEFSCTVIEMNGHPIALDPCQLHFPEHLEPGRRFLTTDSKFESETRIILMKESDDPDLFRKIQEAGVQAWRALPKHGSFMGVDIDCRVDQHGEVVVLEVNPMPVAFLPDATGFADLPVIASLPGAHRAAINIFIANYFLSQKKSIDVATKVAETHDWFSKDYDKKVNATGRLTENVTEIVTRYNFDGSVLDVACGTGLVGEIIKKENKITSRLVGIDSSQGMLDQCTKLGVYSEVILGRMQDVLPALEGRRIFDHITCVSALHFMSPYDLSLVLSRMFMLADQSVTLMVDAIPDSYNENLVRVGVPHMHSLNHVDEVTTFGVPRGWKLTDRWSGFAWKSPATGDDIDMTVFRFDRDVVGLQESGSRSVGINGAVDGVI